MDTPATEHPAHTGSHRSSDEHHFLRPNDKIGEGDTSLVLDVLPPDLAETAFESLRKQVKWNTMFHRGTYRLDSIPYQLHSRSFRR